ncbi:unnamed protein product [Paramecium octaurelia]|uniref:Uncharacterized protein n=1 Tax=Paramecium octaurelia TaxID=43137 RepID=A0A8S1TU18_PAROT|nr:unnamed protein product [Paramecium octaurelia]
MKIFSPHTMRMLIPRFSRTFLQKEIIQDPLAASSKSMNTPKIYRTKTGQISMGLYEKMLQEAKEKSLAIPSPDADIPYNFEGIDQIPETKDSFLFQQILNENEIREKTLQTHLIKMYQGFLMSMEVADETYLNEYCEKGFAEKTLEALEKLKMRGERVVAFEDFSVTSGQPFPYQGFFVDQVMVRGLSTIRSENLPKSQYHYYNDLDKLGCVVFTPLSLQDPSNFKTKEQGDKLYDDYKKVLVRCLLRIQSPMRLKLIKPNGQELLESNDNYSYNHLVLFESECEMPPKKKQRRDSYRRVSKFQLETYMEWMRNCVPQVWKIADVDNWMKCNPLIKESHKDFQDEVFQGSKYDENVIDIRRI